MTAKKKKKASVSKKSKSNFPDRIFAQASPRSRGGRSLFDLDGTVDASSVDNFTSEAGVLRSAEDELRRVGFEVLDASETTINIAGPASLYEKVFSSRLRLDERDVIKSMGKKDTATFIDCDGTRISGLIDTTQSGLAGIIEGVAIEEPYYDHAAGSLPPVPDSGSGNAYWHLRVPGDVSLGLNADRAHRAGMTGRGVRVAMTDSGWFRHPHFVERGYRAGPVFLGPGSAFPDRDESGHGTGESANIFAAAPDVSFRMVKMNFRNTTGAFNAAARLRPDIISNSWGGSVRNGPLSAANQALAAAIALAVRRGIIVVFSAGNGHFGFPGQHPDVISAGGVFRDENGKLQASDYSSGFASQVYPGRNVPDVCGLVGMRPSAKYIMLPVEPGDKIDVRSAGGTHPNGDQTGRNDGWAVFSGTSAAAPQIAGVCALVKQACPQLTPRQVRDVLKRTARDVVQGRCHPNQNNAAGPGADLATGHGLVDAQRASLLARLMCSRSGSLDEMAPNATNDPGSFFTPAPDGPFPWPGPFPFPRPMPMPWPWPWPLPGPRPGPWPLPFEGQSPPTEPDDWDIPSDQLTAIHELLGD